MSDDNAPIEQPVTLKGFFKVIFKWKWVLIITLIIVIAAGLVYTFIVAPEYGCSSQIKVSDSDILYSDQIYEYFPDEAYNLWIMPTARRIDYRVGKLDPIAAEIKAGHILSKVVSEVGSGLSERDLVKSIDISIDRELGILTLTTYSKSPDLTYKINNSLLNALINSKKAELEGVYTDLFQKIDLKTVEVKNELTELSKKAQDSTIDFNTRWYEELKNANLEKIDVAFIDPVIKKDIENKYAGYTALENTRQNMLDNKEFFVSRLEIIKNPETFNVYNYSNYLRNILLSIVAALIAGIILVFIVNYFKSSKK